MKGADELVETQRSHTWGPTIYVVVLDRLPVGAFTRMEAARQFIDTHSDDMEDPRWRFSVTCMDLQGGRK